MVQIAQFELAEWIETNGVSAQHDLAGTACSSVSIEDLLNISDNRTRSSEALSFDSVKLSYNAALGSGPLRENLANLYSARAAGVTKDDILITNGAIGANHIVLTALVSKDDHVVCQYPTFEQLYQTPISLGADVSFWKSDPSRNWQLDTNELKSLIKSNTKLIILNNPQNPTGAIIRRDTLAEVFEIAEEKGILVLCDEIFRPLFHSILPSDEGFPPSAINLGYKKVIVTGSMSKAYGLAGLRVGWIACKNREIVNAFIRMRRYTTTSVSRLDEAVAAEALSDRCIHALLGRNIKTCQTNLEQLQGFITEHNWACSWVKPTAGTIGMIKFHKMGKPVDDEQFCTKLQKIKGVMLSPACVCFGGRTDFRGYVRVGFGHDPTAFKAALTNLTQFMEEEFENVPVAPKLG